MERRALVNYLYLSETPFDDKPRGDDVREISIE